MIRRILYLIETLGHGGAEHQLAATVQHLDRTRFEPIVCHFRGPNDLAPALRDAGVQVRCLDVPPGKLHWPELVLKIRSVARDTKADLLHTSLLEADVLGGAAGRLARIPVVSTLCNISGERVRLADNPRNNRFKFAATNWLWGGALRSFHRHSIAISKAVRESAVATFGMDRARISVIYRGLEDGQLPPEVNREQARERLGLASADPLLLSVGRLVPQKGHRYLIAALPELIQQFPQTHLVLVGEGWLKSELEAQARVAGLALHVHFLGKRTDVAQLLAACDIFVFPSLFEGLGVSLLEASYAGCACVATNTGPIPEIIRDGETGLLVTPANSQTLTRALAELAGSRDLRRRLGQSARADALRRFALSDKVTALEREYSRLLDS